jgi:trehalose 6-phosphate synthase/phosphatase
MARAKPRLIVVSHRGPYQSVRSGRRRIRVRTTGGLVSALDPVLAARGGVWVSGDDKRAGRLKDADGKRLGYELATARLSPADRDAFYLGVSNALLWPILHSMPPTVRIGQLSWSAYKKVNRVFCDAVVRVSRKHDLIWIHDFHLMLLPALVRERRPEGRIGWFCHIPWPGFDLFEILPWRAEILEGLLGADVIGFHTAGYAQNFLRCVATLLPGARVNFARRTIRHRGRVVRVVVAPIGVPVDEIQRIAADPTVSAEVQRIRRWVDNRRIILGVDRLDYTKGIPQRLLAFEQLLRNDRNARNRYLFLQIMVPSRTDVRAYADLKTDIDRLVGDINGRYASAGRIPIQYFYRNMAPAELYAHYRAADVALITPLRDGMNLVALEFVACRIHGGGALVLSEFAGAARYLDGALVVNPYDVHAVAEALRRALGMKPREERARMEALRARVRRMDVHAWADGFLAQLERR